MEAYFRLDDVRQVQYHFVLLRMMRSFFELRKAAQTSYSLDLAQFAWHNAAIASELAETIYILTQIENETPDWLNDLAEIEANIDTQLERAGYPDPD